MKPYRIYQSIALFLADIFAFSMAFIFAVSITWFFRAERIGGSFLQWCHSLLPEQLVVYVILVFSTIMVMMWRGYYTLRIPYWDELRQLIKLLMLFGLLNGMVVLLIKIPTSRFLWVAFWGLAIGFLPFIRRKVRSLLHQLRLWEVSTVILGAQAEAQNAYRALASEPLLGFSVHAFITAEKHPAPHLIVNQKKLRIYSLANNTLSNLIDKLQPANIVVALSAKELGQLEPQIEQLSLYHRHIYIVPSLAGLPLFGVETLHFFSHEALFLRIRNNLANWSAQKLKRLFDIVVSGLLCILAIPLFVGIIMRLRFQQNKIFFQHTRIGQHGKKFSCYKFCTMVPDAEKVLAHLLATDLDARAQWEQDFKLKNDPRITSLGAFLRRTSLDELPQLWNVFKGDMSLVGPRPIVESELARYTDKAAFYLCVRPGITGLWQVSGRSNLQYHDRVALDAWYIKNWNLWYDIAILFKTIAVVLKRKGAY